MSGDGSSARLGRMWPFDRASRWTAVSDPTRPPALFREIPFDPLCRTDRPCVREYKLAETPTYLGPTCWRSARSGLQAEGSYELRNKSNEPSRNRGYSHWDEIERALEGGIPSWTISISAQTGSGFEAGVSAGICQPWFNATQTSTSQLQQSAQRRLLSPLIGKCMPSKHRC